MSVCSDPPLGETLVRVGAGAHYFADMVTDMTDRARRRHWLPSMEHALPRKLGFTVGRGLEPGGSHDATTVHGSSLGSSNGGMANRVASATVQRCVQRPAWAVDPHFEIDHYQPLVFILDDRAHLCEQVGTHARWMKTRKPNNVGPEWRVMNDTSGTGARNASLLR